MVTAVSGLAGVVELDEGEGVVGVENGGIRVLGGPDDAILTFVGGNAGSGSGIAEGVGGLSCGGGFEPGTGFGFTSVRMRPVPFVWLYRLS